MPVFEIAYASPPAARGTAPPLSRLDGRRRLHLTALLSRVVDRAVALGLPDSEAMLVVMVLAISVAAFGRFVSIPRGDVEAPSLPAVAAAPPAIPAVPIGSESDVPPLTSQRMVMLWDRNDTRSLQRAFAIFRNDTPALDGCRVRVTTTDQAVARCDAWTIWFARSAGRWRISDAASR